MRPPAAPADDRDAHLPLYAVDIHHRNAGLFCVEVRAFDAAEALAMARHCAANTYPHTQSDEWEPA